MDFIHKYPYSNMHELNLDWLIDETKKLISKVTVLEAEMAEIELVTKEQIELMITEAINNNNIKIAQDLILLHDQITTEYQTYVNNRYNQLKTYLDNQDVYYDNLAKGYADTALIESKQYTDDQVLGYTMMINPITGQYEDVRNVVTDIVNYFHTENSLTAGEYDALDMTAGYYDSKDLTAYDYDFNGKLRLP